MSARVDRWRSSRRGWVVTAAVLVAIVCLACWPRPTLWALAAAAAAVVLVAGVRRFVTERRAVSSCGPECAEGHTYAYRCALKPPPVDPRTILGIDRQEPADDSGADRLAERCCVCGGPDTPYENYRGQLFCWPCADCPCGQVPCVRTGINDPAVSAAAADRADVSGRVPETARTHPDAGGEQRDDQAGEHPDASGQHAGPGHAMLAALAQSVAALPAPAPRHPDAALRGRVAAVLLTRIKQAVITDATPFGPGPVSTLIAATEYDLADVVLAELAPELAALTAARAGDGPWLRAYREDLIAAQDAIQRIERQAQDWARLAPPNDVGCTPDDTAYANAGRVLLDLLSEPVSTEGA